MEIEQSFSVPFPRAQVWACFQDIEGVVACLPGAGLAEPPQDSKLKLTMTVKLGPIVAAFAGDGEMKLDDASCTGAVSGSGADRKSGSRVKGEAAFALHEEGAAATRVEVKVDYSIAGSLAQFSRGGIVKELATRLTEAFAANLKGRLEALPPAVAVAAPQDASQALAAEVAPVLESAAASLDASLPAPAPATAAPTAIETAASSAPAGSATAVPAPAAPRPASAPLDVGNLFWRMLLDRIKGWFGLGKGSKA
ncbi:carbon monoxide dehydrogenase [Azoarcus indigens]|uniref:Carbon monoxide dehydrogenase subunit G n=1 Tax=Azoarcus indigens TaxID=29545 RepID=A0A4R6DI92_9RHOO|nr:SRPBCC family protein [Azoarcus indigens]NMG66061.1 carbon monoxide dehydrogenase [Azoarcus indigens]TDN43818.1 carbon monoxide dehydrogenase subunit G [Azoarcus indigens]